MGGLSIGSMICAFRHFVMWWRDYVWIAVRTLLGGWAYQLAPLELPIGERRIWGSSTGVGVDDTQLSEILNGNFANVFVERTPCMPAGGPLQPGDHVMLAPGSFPTARTISPDGTSRAPIVFRAPRGSQQLVRVQGLWTITGNWKILWGLTFEGGEGKLRLGNVANQVLTPASSCGVIRCEFTGWSQGQALTACGNGGPKVPGCYIWYCSFHDPAPWTSAEMAVPTPSLEPLRMGIRSAEIAADIVGTFPYNWHIKRTEWYSFPDKPRPASYGSGQDDAIEWGRNGPTIAAATLTVTRNAAGIVTSILTNLHSGLLVEDCVVRDHQEGGGTGAACFDLKCGGNTIRRVAFRNCAGRSDNRWGPFNLWEDIAWESGSPGMWSSGYGHTMRRTIGGTMTLTSGENNDAAGFADGHQASQACLIEDRDGVVGIATGTAGYTDFPARDCVINRCTPPAPAVGPNATRIGCTFDGQLNAAPPQNIPPDGTVGVNAPWAG
jgi:hypothetical protein